MVMNESDYKNYYESSIYPYYKKWKLNLLISCLMVFLLMLLAIIIATLFNLPPIVIYFPAIIGGLVIYRQTIKIKNIKCPNCKNSLYNSLYNGKITMNSNKHLYKQCNHCNTKFV